MSTGAHNGFITTALQKYRYPDMAKKDVLSVFTTYTDLRPKLEPYVFNDGVSKDLLRLEGTVPVSYKNNTYNIPVCLWLLDTHPYSPPLVYVRPTSTMRIRPGRHVDANGKIDLPYLQEWKFPQSDLLGLIHELLIVFGEEPPLYAAGNMQDVFSCQAFRKYKFADLTKNEVTSVVDIFRDLRPKVEPFVFTDGESKDLLCLEGTIPAYFKDRTYNIPVCVWLRQTHPHNPPTVYVRPTSTMEIRVRTHVDANGEVKLPYLDEWKYPQSNLPGLLHTLCIAFGEEIPVQSIAGD